MKIKEIIIDRNFPKHWKNIYLIGYMGVGKSSTAKHLGNLLDMPVIELDQLIEDYYGKTIPEIFEEMSEKDFRALETLILATAIPGGLVKYDLLKGAVFSCGGGAALSSINVTAMQNSGKIIWLTASPEEVLNRLSKSSEEDDSDGDTSNGRPLLKGKMNIADISDMMELRSPYYEEAADIIIDTDGKTPDAVAGEIIMALDLIPSVS